MINRFGVDLEEELTERNRQVSGYPLIDGTTGVDLDTRDEPHPFFQLTGSPESGWEDELVHFEPVDESDKEDQE